MNKGLFFLLILLSFQLNAQHQQKDYRLGLFAEGSAHIGFDLASVIGTNEDREKHLTLGLGAQMGVQPLTWLAISGGFRYSYITPNYHLLGYNIQPYFFIGAPENEDFNFLSFKWGKKQNRNLTSMGNWYGHSIGKIEVGDRRQLGQKMELSLDFYDLGQDKFAFIGFSYAIVLFSNKSL